MKLLHKITALISVFALLMTVAAVPAFAEDETRTGQGAMRLTISETPKWSGPYQTTSCQPNTDYTITAWLKGDARVSIVVKTTDWKEEFGDGAKIAATATDTWTEYSGTFNSGENTELLIQFIDSNVGSVVYVDDLTIKGPDGVDILRNGNFEAGISFWEMGSTGAFEVVTGTATGEDTLEEGEDASLKMIDTYGQFITANFDRKITSDEELLATTEKEKEYMDSLTTPDNFDEYGGVLGSKDALGFEATGFFHTETMPNGKPALVDPAGNLFFSVGSCGIGYPDDSYTMIKGRENVYEWLPVYGVDTEFDTAFRNGNGGHFSFHLANYIKKHGKPWTQEEYSKEQIERAKKLGFNSGGAWSRVLDYGMPQMVMLTMPSTGNRIGGARLFDVFGPTWEADIDASIKQSVEANVDNELIIGYFIANELNFDKMKTAIPTAKASEVGSKRKLVDVLKELYGGDIAKFNAAWEKSYASFDDMYEATDLSITTNQADADFDEYLKVYFEQYYRTVSETFRKYDPNHMLCGDRIMTSISKDDKLMDIVCAAAGKYNDILSYNNYRSTLDLEKVQSMYEAAGIPLMLTEWSYPNTDNGMTPFGVNVKDPEAKGLAYKNYIEQHAALGCVVGTHWFEWVDQAPTGRYFDGLAGESYAFGMVDVTDTIYFDTAPIVKEANENIYSVFLGEEPAFEYEGLPDEKEGNLLTQIPLANEKPTIDGALDASWPAGPEYKLGADSVVSGESQGAEGTFRFAWDTDNLYLFADITDATPLTNTNEGEKIWNGDAVELFFGPEEDMVVQNGALKVKDSQLIMAATPDMSPVYRWYNNRADQPEIEMAVVAKDGGYCLEAAIPMAALNMVDNIRDGREVRFDFGFDDGTAETGRKAQAIWSSKSDASSVRSDWATATLVATYDPSQVTTPSGSFSDLGEAEWAREAIEALAKDGIVDGVSDGVFAPNDNITREAFVKIIVGALGLTDEGATASFTDVAADAWYAPFIASASAAGIVNGNPDGTFGVGQNITRQEMVTIAYRAANIAGVALDAVNEPQAFADASEIADWASTAVQAMQTANVVNGMEDGRFAPNENTTRAQAAKIIYSLVQ